jgi:hypothetical protein
LSVSALCQLAAPSTSPELRLWVGELRPTRSRPAPLKLCGSSLRLVSNPTNKMLTRDLTALLSCQRAHMMTPCCCQAFDERDLTAFKRE